MPIRRIPGLPALLPLHSHGVVLLLLTSLNLAGVTPVTLSADRNLVSRVDSNDVWYPHKDFPKLVTPQWVGDEGVECVVTLAIDDMRDTATYEIFLRPILERLKQIDGRAPISIMACSIKPDASHLQQWLAEGLSLECHTFDHPWPLLAQGNIKSAKETYDKCVDRMFSIPNNSPVAFRTPCCNVLNTVSPRIFSEIINRTTRYGHFLQLDSSVFNIYTAEDTSIPRDLLVDPDGKPKFAKYIPRRFEFGGLRHDNYANTIKNYPYPYVIQRLCWEFPCVVPSDWSANRLNKADNPDTVRDLNAALDITVQKQGVFNFVFHPDGSIKAEQVIELIDHAVATHGAKVKFLTFRECLDRLNQNLLRGESLRTANGRDNGFVLLDVNDDGFQDVLKCSGSESIIMTWNPKEFGWSQPSSGDTLVRSLAQSLGGPRTLHDANGADVLIRANRQPGIAIVDLNEDGHDDVLLSNQTRAGAWLYNPAENDWNIELFDFRRGEANPLQLNFPSIVREDGSDNGFFVKDRGLCWINEDTGHLPDFMIRVEFDRLLGEYAPRSNQLHAGNISTEPYPDDVEPTFETKILPRLRQIWIRNRLLLISIILVVVMSVAGCVVGIWQAIKATRALRRYELRMEQAGWSVAAGVRPIETLNESSHR